MADNHAPGLSVATALFFVWSILFFTVRAWVKSRRSEGWDWDDTTISAALVVTLLHVISTFWSINAGNGLPVSTLSDHNRNILEKAIYASQIFYVTSIGLIRVSSGIFIARLTRHGQRVYLAYTVTALCGLWTIASVPAIGLRGDLKSPWSVLDGSQTSFTRWIGIETSGLALEVSLWGICVSIIWSLSMPIVKRLLILAIFGCRLLLIPLVALRLKYLSPRQNTEVGVTNETANIMTEAILNFAIISSCVTCLKPFFQPFHAEYVVSTVNTGEGTWPSGSATKSRDTYYKLSAISEFKDRSAARSSMRDSDLYEPPDVANRYSVPASAANGRILRPDQFDQCATVSAHPRSPSADQGMDADRMIIRKTETWSVRIEEDKRGADATGQAGVAV